MTMCAVFLGGSDLNGRAPRIKLPCLFAHPLSSGIGYRVIRYNSFYCRRSRLSCLIQVPMANNHPCFGRQLPYFVDALYDTRRKTGGSQDVWMLLLTL